MVRACGLDRRVRSAWFSFRGCLSPRFCEAPSACFGHPSEIGQAPSNRQEDVLPTFDALTKKTFSPVLFFDSCCRKYAPMERQWSPISHSAVRQGKTFLRFVDKEDVLTGIFKEGSTSALKFKKKCSTEGRDDVLPTLKEKQLVKPKKCSSRLLENRRRRIS